MKSALIVLLVLVAVLLSVLFIALLVINSKQEKEGRKEGISAGNVTTAGSHSYSNGKNAVKSGNTELAGYRRRSFESYRNYQEQELIYRQYRSIFCEEGIFFFLKNLFTFRRSSEERHINAADYRKAVLEDILDPLNRRISEEIPYSDGEYRLNTTFTMFLTADEYYEQQLAYSKEQCGTVEKETVFWQERLARNEEKLGKLHADSGNQFFRTLWETCKPLLEEAEAGYRTALRSAPTRDAGYRLTRDLTDRLEETLFRNGIQVLWYERALGELQKKAFIRGTAAQEAPAILRERDGLVYEKGIAVLP